MNKAKNESRERLKMAAVSQAKSSIGNINTFYLYGGQGEPIVFLHGVPSSSFLWRKVMPSLADNFSLYAPDLPGFGYSATPQDFGIETYVAWLHDFCRRLIDGKVNLVVHDLGGTIGFAFALKYMKMVKRLVVMDALASFKDAQRLMKFMASPPVLWLSLKLTNKYNVNWTMKNWFVHQKNKMDRGAVDHYYQFFLRDKKENIRHRLYSAWRPEIDNIVGYNIGRINCPSLVLWAEKDFILPVRLAKVYGSRLKNSTVKVLPNCGHFSQEEEPELIASHIREFINET